jgi:hypothetical protein
LLSLEVLPVAPYEVDDDVDSELCSEERNCCNMSAMELVLELVPDVSDVLPVLSVEDEPSEGGGPPGPPGGGPPGPPGPPGPLPNAALKAPCSSVA